ncbi:MAG: hypothetical protein CBC83_09785 [Flavobacteriales bacterium TMED123]|nr:MAG: hypothetical protein CBC83_09785 [Flavobacteriales bacterium TMED123]|tara:strand:+ start:3737 stop:4330 length:594 start_codon:yes stop_codon:yes gene_type:complete
MQFIEDIKHRFGRWVFQRELKSNKRTKAVSNLENAKSIGILYEATDAVQIKKIEPFVKYFFELKKDVKALGYVNKKKLDNHHIPKLNYDFFYLKDLNWYYKPQNYIISNFVKKEYDILINLSDSNCIPIKYLVASSLAHFKIGQFEDGFEIYDLMIKLDKEKSKERLMEEIKHYLNLINKKNASAKRNRNCTSYTIQ